MQSGFSAPQNMSRPATAYNRGLRVISTDRDRTHRVLRQVVAQLQLEGRPTREYIVSNRRES
jgi:hypothetical protein